MHKTDRKRQDQRRQVDEQWAANYNPPRKRSNEGSRAASTDSARLDIVDWLAHQMTTHPNRPISSPGATPAPPNAAPEQGEQDVPAAGHAAPDSLPGRPAPGEPDDRPVQTPEIYPSVVDQVTTFAEAMTRSVWHEIAGSLADDP